MADSIVASAMIDRLVHRVDADGSGEGEFDEFAVLLRAINPQNIRPTDVESITFESHPLVEQVLSLQRGAKLQLMYAEPSLAERQAKRATALDNGVRRLERANGARRTEPQKWQAVLKLLREISRQQHDAASAPRAAGR